MKKYNKIIYKTHTNNIKREEHMRAFIFGGRGFIGKHLTASLLSRGFTVTIVDNAPYNTTQNTQYLYVRADTTKSGSWQNYVENADIIINLAGAPIFGRWTPKMKTEIYNSRILTTKNIVDAMPSKKSLVFFSTSAQGYYGFRGNEILDEDSSAGTDFLSRVCIDWEREALKACKKGGRVIITRFGIVLGKNGGMLRLMEPIFKLFLGGRLGKGTQWISWIHIEDLIRAYFFILENPSIFGAVNVCTPHPITNAQLTKALGKALHRPTFFAIPSLLIKLLLGEFGHTLLQGQHVIPKKLIEKGFTYLYPTIEQALKNIYS